MKMELLFDACFTSLFKGNFAVSQASLKIPLTPGNDILFLKYFLINFVFKFFHLFFFSSSQIV